jgi:hypothetical protein
MGRSRWLSPIAKDAKAALGTKNLDAVADRGYFSSEAAAHTTSRERRITRWEHEHILEAVQRRLDEHPEKMRHRRETVEHPFGTIKARMGATHFLMKTLPRVAAEMACTYRPTI